MALLDVNALVALAWDAHVHHARMRSWFRERSGEGWMTCPVTELGFVRISANRRALPGAISVSSARAVLAGLRGVGAHRFLADDVSPLDPDVPEVAVHRQVTDAHLLALARRHGASLVTFDAALAKLGGDAVELLAVL